jgi:hypothetical protein
VHAASNGKPAAVVLKQITVGRIGFLAPKFKRSILIIEESALRYSGHVGEVQAPDAARQSPAHRSLGAPNGKSSAVTVIDEITIMVRNGFLAQETA